MRSVSIVFISIWYLTRAIHCKVYCIKETVHFPSSSATTRHRILEYVEALQTPDWCCGYYEPKEELYGKGSDLMDAVRDLADALLPTDPPYLDLSNSISLTDMNSTTRICSSTPDVYHP